MSIYGINPNIAPVSPYNIPISEEELETENPDLYFSPPAPGDKKGRQSRPRSESLPIVPLMLTMMQMVIKLIGQGLRQQPAGRQPQSYPQGYPPPYFPPGPSPVPFFGGAGQPAFPPQFIPQYFAQPQFIGGPIQPQFQPQFQQQFQPQFVNPAFPQQVFIPQQGAGGLPVGINPNQLIAGPGGPIPMGQAVSGGLPVTSFQPFFTPQPPQNLDSFGVNPFGGVSQLQTNPFQQQGIALAPNGGTAFFTSNPFETRSFANTAFGGSNGFINNTFGTAAFTDNGFGSFNHFISGPFGMVNANLSPTGSFSLTRAA